MSALATTRVAAFRRKFLLAALTFSLVSVFSFRAQGSDPVPPRYQPLYNYLDGQISAFQTMLAQNWNGSTPPVDFSAEVHGANSSQGTNLLASNYYQGVLAEVDSLKAVGVKAVHVDVSFPVLTPAYYSDPTVAQQMINFYQQLATDIRARGLKLIVETGLVIHTDSNGNVQGDTYASGLSLTGYENGRAQTAATIAQVMHPDYLTVLNEPDTEAAISQKPALNTISGSQTLLNAILQAVQATGVQGIKIGAGMGSWLPNPNQWVGAFALTSINYIDIHLFPVTSDFLTRLFTFSQAAQANGKQLAISQAWLYKMAQGETTGYGVIHGRDPFGFWAPLDSKFLRAMVDFAHYSNTAFFSPFWTRYFHAYLDYTQYGNLTGAALEKAAAKAAANASGHAILSDTGIAYLAKIVSPADVSSPSAPSSLAATAANPTTISLNWNAATDDVGVLGYQIYRDGALLDTVAATTYLDTNLSPVYHTYVVRAFDASGNISPPSNLVTQGPLDIIPPSTPTQLSGTSPAATQVRLTWTASTDNLGVAGYRVYRGTAPSNLTLIGSSAANSWIDNNVVPGVTFYYAVTAFDAAQNTSGFSQTIAVAVLRDTTPPSVPTGLAGQALSLTSVSLSWNASTDDWHMGGYAIYRGTSASVLNLIGGSAITTFLDTAANPGTTYYYAVSAFDAFGNTSAKSTPLTIAMPPDITPPAAPANVTATANSRSQVTVSWTASSDNVRVKNYVILRGTSPKELGLVGGVVNSPFVDTRVSRGTTYYYVVYAVDEANNYSSPSQTVQAITPP